jgi:hypothetical protein
MNPLKLSLSLKFTLASLLVGTSAQAAVVNLDPTVFLSSTAYTFNAGLSDLGNVTAGQAATMTNLVGQTATGAPTDAAFIGANAAVAAPQSVVYDITIPNPGGALTSFAFFNDGGGAIGQGVTGFTVTLYSGAGATGSVLASITGAPSVTLGQQDFSLGGSITGVQSFEFQVNSRALPTGNLDISELAFVYVVPEPSSALLGGLGALALLRRRRA